MRFALFLGIILAAGIVAGAAVGRTVAGSTEPSDTLVPAVHQDVASPAGDQLQEPRTRSPGAVGQHHSPAPATALAKPLIATTIAQVVQASRVIPSGLTVLRGLPGDVNGDRVVNTKDLRIVAGASGTTPPEPPAADINGDGRVDVFDLAIVGLHLGETLP